MSTMSRAFHLAGWAILFACSLHGGAAQAHSIDSPRAVKFDEKTLRARGYSGDIARFFAREARFLPGSHEVMFSLNGKRPISAQAHFDGNGELRFDTALLAELSLREPSQGDFLAVFPETRVTLKPGQNRVDLIVPERAIVVAERSDGFRHEGAAVMLNYDLYAQRSHGEGRDWSLLSGRFEPGFNVGNWVFRSRQSWYRDGERHAFVHHEAYAAHAIESIRSMFRIGQLQSAGQAFGGIPMTGVQLSSDSAQSDSAQLGMPIQGMARTQALVEVRQRGQLVYKTLVAPGPFTLSSAGPLVSGVDVEVEVVEEDGSRQRFVVAAATGFSDPGRESSFSISAGLFRDADGSPAQSGADAAFFTSDFAHSPRANLRLSHSAMVARGYQGLATQGSFVLSPSATINGSTRLSNSRLGLGGQFDVNGHWHVSARWSLSASAQHRSRRYLDGGSAFLSDRSESKRDAATSYGAGIGYGHPRWGGFSYGHYRGRTSSGGASRSDSFGYSHRIRSTSLNFSGSQSRGSDQNDRMFSLSLSMPVAGRNLLARAYDSRGSRTYQAQYGGKVFGDLNYSLGATRYGDDTRLDVSASKNTNFSHLNTGISVDGEHHTLRFGASGALVAGGGTVAATSSPIGDTFGIVRVPGVAGLRINAATSGQVITDRRGVAVVPSLSPYSQARIEVDGRSIPKNYRLKTTVTELALAHGSVGRTEIPATEIRQLLLDIHRPDQSPVPVGASVHDDDGNLLSTVIGKGNVMLVNADIGKPLGVVMANGSRCQVRYTTPERFDPDKPYEEAKARCD